MTYPQYPSQPGYPAQPQAPGYPSQNYPPAPPQAPGYPQYPAQPQAPGYPAAPPQAPQAPLPQTGLADFVNQPSAGGGNLQFPAIGHRHIITVARDLGDSDFPPQTDMTTGAVRKFPDGRVMTRMVIPCLVQPDAAHPDGRATLSVQGQMAEALKQAMSTAGAGHLRGVPEAGAVITVAWTSERPPKRAGYNAQHIYECTYQRPPGAAQADTAAARQQAPAQAPPAQPNGQAVPPPAPLQQAPAQAQYQAPPAAPQYQAPAPPPAPVYGQAVPGQPVSQPAPGMMAPGQQVAQAAQAGMAAAQAAQAPAQPVAPPPGMDPETAALLANLTGQAPVPPQQ